MKLTKIISCLFFFLVSILSCETIGWSSAHQAFHDAPGPGASADNILAYFNSPERQGLLRQIAQDVFNTDKDKPKISQKICAHQEEALEWWHGKISLENLTETTRKALPRNVRSSLSQRPTLVIFAPSIDENQAKNLAEAAINKEDSRIFLSQVGGTMAYRIEIIGIFESIIGSVYEKDPSLPGKPLNKIKLMININNIIENIQKTKQYINSEKGELLTICPSEGELN